MLVITPVSGASITIGFREVGKTITVNETDPKRQTSLLSVTGRPGDPIITFELHGYYRGWLSKFAPLAALNPVQLINRASVIQVTSQKPCQFCRFNWTHIPYSIDYAGYNVELNDKSEETGVFTLSQV